MASSGSATVPIQIRLNLEEVARLDAYRLGQPIQPTRAAVVKHALLAWLAQQGQGEEGKRPVPTRQKKRS
jgi:hypothetical protein